MRNGKYVKKARRSVLRKPLALVLSLVLIAVGAAGGTVAWLLDSTDPLTNIFAVSDIDVELNETVATYKMIPGWVIDKDPVVTLAKDSEDCYVFVKVEKSGGNITIGETTYSFDDFIAYAIDEGWMQLNNGTTPVPGVYYRVVGQEEKAGSGAAIRYHVLGAGSYVDAENVTYTWTQDQVLTKPEVTKEMMKQITAENQPKLTFTAYAVQLWKTNKPAKGATQEQIAAAQFTAYEAWQKISS